MPRYLDPKTDIVLLEESAYTPGELAAYEEYWDAVSTEKTLISEATQAARTVGLAEGRTQGLLEGEAAFLIRLLNKKFDNVPEKYLTQIHQADAELLLIWGERVLEAKTLEEVFIC